MMSLLHIVLIISWWESLEVMGPLSTFFQWWLGIFRSWRCRSVFQPDRQFAIAKYFWQSERSCGVVGQFLSTGSFVWLAAEASQEDQGLFPIIQTGHGGLLEELGRDAWDSSSRPATHGWLQFSRKFLCFCFFFSEEDPWEGLTHSTISLACIPSMPRTCWAAPFLSSARHGPFLVWFLPSRGSWRSGSPWQRCSSHRKEKDGWPWAHPSDLFGASSGVLEDSSITSASCGGLCTQTYWRIDFKEHYCESPQMLSARNYFQRELGVSDGMDWRITSSNSEASVLPVLEPLQARSPTGSRVWASWPLCLEGPSEI